jgi:hypothetical protein
MDIVHPASSLAPVSKGFIPAEELFVLFILYHLFSGDRALHDNDGQYTHLSIVW